MTLPLLEGDTEVQHHIIKSLHMTNYYVLNLYYRLLRVKPVQQLLCLIFLHTMLII